MKSQLQQQTRLVCSTGNGPQMLRLIQQCLRQKNVFCIVYMQEHEDREERRYEKEWKNGRTSSDMITQENTGQNSQTCIQ